MNVKQEEVVFFELSKEHLANILKDGFSYVELPNGLYRKITTADLFVDEAGFEMLKKKYKPSKNGSINS